MSITKRREHRLFFYPILGGCLLLAFLFYNFVVPQTPGRLLRHSMELVPKFPLWSWIASQPLPVPSQTEAVAIGLVLFAILAFVAYGTTVYLSWKQKGKPAALVVVVLLALVFFFVSVLSLPNVNTDIYLYVLHGRVAAVHGSNPYYVVADEFPDDPLYPYASRNYTNRPGDKLPAWMIINVVLARLAGDDPVNSLLFYRTTFFLFNAANLGLIAAILRRLQPEYLLAGLVLYGWNPIVVLYGQSKIDTVMTFYLLLAAWFLVVDRERWSIVFLGLSALVKLITLPLAAVYLLRQIRLRQWRQLAVELVLLVATAVLLSLLFWQGPGLIANIVGLLRVAGSATADTGQWVLQLLFILVVLWTGITQDGRLPRLLWGWSVVLLYFSLFLIPLGNSWYLITLIALASLSLDWRLTFMTLSLSFSAFLFNIWYSTFTRDFAAPELFATPRFLVYLAIPLLVAMVIAGGILWQKSVLITKFIRHYRPVTGNDYE